MAITPCLQDLLCPSAPFYQTSVGGSPLFLLHNLHSHHPHRRRHLQRATSPGQILHCRQPSTRRGPLSEMTLYFLRTKKSKFELHAEDKILNKPGWFLRLESHEDSASEVLWPNVIRLERDSDYSVKHWSLRFLRYAVVERADRPALPSAFASMIVFEVIFTVLTPYPEEWPGGIDAISELTRS